MYCAETAAEAEEGWEYFYNQLKAAQHHYLEWNNPGYAGIPGYESYLQRQTADVGVAEAGFAARRATQPIGTPDEIIAKIKTLQHALSLEMLVVQCSTAACPGTRPQRACASLPRKSSPPCRPCLPRSIPPRWAKGGASMRVDVAKAVGMASTPRGGSERAEYDQQKGSPYAPHTNVQSAWNNGLQVFMMRVTN